MCTEHSFLSSTQYRKGKQERKKQHHFWQKSRRPHNIGPCSSRVHRGLLRNYNMKLNKHGLPTSVCTNSRQGFQLRDILKSSPEEEDRSSRKEPRSYAKCSDMKKINKELKKKKTLIKNTAQCRRKTTEVMCKNKTKNPSCPHMLRMAVMSPNYLIFMEMKIASDKQFFHANTLLRKLPMSFILAGFHKRNG